MEKTQKGIVSLCLISLAIAFAEMIGCIVFKVNNQAILIVCSLSFLIFFTVSAYTTYISKQITETEERLQGKLDAMIETLKQKK